MNVPEKLGVTNINCFHGAWMGNREMLQEVCLWAQKLIWTTISTKIGRKKGDWQRALLGAGEGRLRMEPEESAEAPWLIPAPSEWWPLCPWPWGSKWGGHRCGHTCPREGETWLWSYLLSWGASSPANGTRLLWKLDLPPALSNLGLSFQPSILACLLFLIRLNKDNKKLVCVSTYNMPGSGLSNFSWMNPLGLPESPDSSCSTPHSVPLPRRRLILYWRGSKIYISLPILQMSKPMPSEMNHELVAE